MADTGPDRLFRGLEQHVANPILRVVLRSPIHRLVSGTLVLLSYEGRQSGRRFTTPVAYERDGTDVVVTTFRDEAVWWRNFRDGHPATLWLRGEPVDATGRASTDEAVVADWLETLADRDSRLLSFFDVPAEGDRAAREAAAEDLVVVRFALA